MTQLKSKGISLDNLQANFKEVHTGLNTQEAMEESNRCLYCYDAPCIKACPTSIDIPKFIKKIASGNLKGSATTIMEANPVGATCARVCPTEELCEGACVLNHSTEPILIGDLQRFATDWAIKNEQLLFKPGEKNGKKVAVIGGGPAGLASARELARFGYEVTIFEAEKEAGGLDTYGIVSFRLPQDVSRWEVDQVRKLDVEIRTNTKVGVDVSLSELEEKYDAVVLTIGMGHVPMLGIPGEELEGVRDAIEFVKETKTQPITKELLGKNVIVVGAGNTAIDAATCAARKGAADVKIVYRRTAKEMTAYDFEYDFAKQDDVSFHWLTQPVEVISDEEGRVSGLKCMKMALGEAEADGRRKTAPVEDSEFTMDVDVVIKAIGQNRYTEMLEQFGLDHANGVLKVDPETLQTSKENVYAAGDVIFAKGQGEAMVVTAAQQGKEAAMAIHKKLAPAPTLMR
ncbi:NAD(P)-dependent oxidoreductase [Halobacillus sp. BAB-2008]|uniref:NAD(P)-dependent oxidoreductase n=1 Tax=Halobacillus sp. BAB-2008 TaxID=1246484 RepID=UPI0002A506E9|nr:NAD(P)-dependent oxidoreductase [Halobacillus sp. BAB-2008]ELK46554.1 dihydropyrimidine dehydrogenase subunit A [Halobacillus sp. BAB-2008]